MEGLLSAIPLIVSTGNRLPWIQSIVISTSKRHVEELRELVSRYGFDKVVVVEGGSTRHRSIHAGVKTLQQVCADVEVVVIHDAVRPFVAQHMLEKIVKAAHCHGAAGVCRPLVSTVIARDADQRLMESLDRSRYYNSEMPQAFQLPVISNAYSKCTSDDFDHGTECLLLAMKYSGVHAKIVDGSADLWKVTYKKDLSAAEAVIKERLTRVAVIGGNVWPQLSDMIAEQLKSLQFQVIQDSQSEQDMSKPPDSSQSGPNSDNTFVILHADLNASEPHLNIVNTDVNNASGDTAVARNNTNGLENCGNALHSECLSNADTKASNRTERPESEDSGNKVATTLNHTASNESKGSGLLSKMKSVQGQILPSQSHPGLVDYSFIHIFRVSMETEGVELQGELSKSIMKLSKDCQGKGVLVYGILALGEVSAERISEMTATVIQRGHISFSGQLFLVC
ncbi:uncharacterized protein [Littorina saxatilis]|uniref:uncharacterized protein isoform X2 n=1 Tax=Littorina saxatilis TaxID=31220 RepID=UPI0038B4F732